jgi:hypothetical protein
MGILPYRRLMIETVLPPEEITRRLHAELTAPRSSPARRASLEGRIVGQAIEIRRTRAFPFLNTIHAVAKGRIIPGRAGASLALTMTLNSYARTFGTLWLSVAAVVFVGFGIAYLRDTTFGRQAGPGALALLPFGYLLLWAGFWIDAIQVEHCLRRLIAGANG